MIKYQSLTLYIFLTTSSIIASEQQLIRQQQHGYQEETSCWQQTVWRSPYVRKTAKVVIYTGIVITSIASLWNENNINIPICDLNSCTGDTCSYQCPDYVIKATHIISGANLIYSAMKLGSQCGPLFYHIRSQWQHWQHRESLEEPHPIPSEDV